MPRYFYDIAKGAEISRDEIGCICRDDDAALRHAWSALPTMASSADPNVALKHHEMRIRREDGPRIGRVEMTLRVDRSSPLSSPKPAL